MRTFVLALLAAAGLAGCASTPGVPPSGGYGNFLGEQAPASLTERLAADTAKQLAVLYPPANTRFNLGQPANDGYGAALVEALRTRGYGLAEFVPAPAEAASASQAPAPAAARGGLSLRYLVDAPAGTDLYRVMVMVGSTSLTRAYVAQNNSFFPASAWMRKE